MNDLTRWNRAGLSRFRYVDGNAATHLELLRRALDERFAGRWEALRTGVPEDLGAEPSGDRQRRLLAQYHRPRGDWGWEIARALARACHVLTEHVDAYANESYLGTATQWDEVRRLVEMLDYSPAPPASASVRLVLGTGGAGVVEAGFQVQHKPPDGGPPLTFETLEELEVEPALDTLRPAGWDRSPGAFLDAPAGPEPPVGERPAGNLQGIGKAYTAWLDGMRQIESGDPETRCRIADLAALDAAELAPVFFEPAARPPRQPATQLRLRLREMRGKAEALLGFPWRASELAPLLDWTAAEVVAASKSELALQAGRSAEEVGRLQEDLRLVEIVLDQPAFESMRLRELTGGAACADPGATPWIAPEKSAISAGQVGILVRDAVTPEAVVVTVDRVGSADGALTLRTTAGQGRWRHWTRGETTLRIKPRFIHRPRLNGPDAVIFEAPHDLATGEVAAWEEGDTWRFASVEEADERGVRLAFGNVPPLGGRVYRAHPIRRVGGELLFPAEYRAAARRVADGLRPLAEDDSEVVQRVDGEPVAGARYRRLSKKLSSVVEIFLVPALAAPAGRIVTSGEALIFDGKPGELASGQWVVADDGATLWPLRVARLEEREASFAVALAPSARPPQSFGRRAVGNLPVRNLQGVGPTYATRLERGNVRLPTLGELSRVEPVRMLRLRAIPPVLLWEFKAKADFLLGLDWSRDRLEPLVERRLPQILAADVAELAGEIGEPVSTVERLAEDLRMCEACLDEDAFRDLTLGDLLPGPPQGADPALPSRVVRLYGLFEHTLRPAGWNRNETPLTGDHIPLAVDRPGLLTRGRRVVLEREVLGGEGGVGFEAARETRVERVDEDDRAVVLALGAPLIESDGYTLGNTVLRANVVPAGHGERRPEKVLGSGDATRSNQRFVLAQEGVSFVADASRPSGVRADVTVRVEGRSWTQVANLRDSGPADPHYAVRVTEEGHLAVEFGDGRHGRRLPTGTNNVRIAFRVGSGLAGNLTAGSLERPARPHRLVDSVRQPLPAAGGNEMEDVASLKANAPASVLTLERAVSVEDLERLAARQSSVWQARAFRMPTGLGRRESVEVVVVPPQGGPLGDLAATLESTLQAHTLPGVDVRVTRAELIAFSLSAVVRVKSDEYEPERVVEAVRRALLDTFSLARRRLGQDLFLSEIYQVVEGVAGVESSTCTLGTGARRLDAGDRKVLHLEPAEPTSVRLRSEEWQP